MSLPRLAASRRLSPLFAALALTSCGGSDSPTGNNDPDPTPTVSAVVFLTPPSAQVAGSTVSAELRVENTAGQPMPGQVITLTASAGTVSPSTVTTGTPGTATVSWTLGTTAGSQTITASSSGRSATLTLSVGPAAAAAFEKASGDAQQGAAGEQLAKAVVVAVKDGFGNVRSGESVSVAVTGGGGSVGSATAATGSDGLASIAWILGDALGENALTVTHALGTLTFTATGRPGAPASVTVVSGSGQSAPAGSELTDPVVVEVKDRLGHRVGDARVAFVVTSGGGAASPDTVSTDAEGLAQARWTLGGAPGEQTMEARVGNAPPAVFQASAQTGAAAGLSIVSGDGQEGTVGQPLGAPVVVEVVDAFGNGVGGVAVTFATADTGGEVAPAQGITGGDGRVSAAWTLGTMAGAQGLTASADGLTSVAVTALAAPGPAAEVRAAAGSGQTGMVGKVLANPLVAEVVDAFDNPVAGATVIFVPAAGSGTVEPVSGESGTDGRFSASWALGTGSGTQTVSAAVASLHAATFTATATSGPPAAMTKVSGDNQSAPVSTAVAIPPRVKVVDTFGNAVSGASVMFAVASGGGSLTGATVGTAEDGTASVGSWTLGSSAGPNTLTAAVDGLTSVTFTATATAAAQGAFEIELRLIGSISPNVQSAFSAAAARWEQVITGDLSTVSLTADQVSQCENAPAEALVVDDLVIYVEVAAIDGVGGTLGSAGPCWTRINNGLPIVGNMTFDEADLADMESDGTLGDVILHEMGHVLGIGTIWDTKGLIQNAGSDDPFFSGVLAIGAFQGMGGNVVNGVPVENTGGEGTRDGHWRETVFQRELMTGYISEPGNPLSLMSVQSLTDMGYEVDTGASDSYALPPPAPGPARAPDRGRSPWEVLLRPVGVAGGEGEVR